MSNHDLVLNISVNLNRISRWAMEGKKERINQFLKDTEYYLDELEKAPRSDRFNPTLLSFKKTFVSLKNDNLDEVYAENALTWANILQHRAKLA